MVFICYPLHMHYQQQINQINTPVRVAVVIGRGKIKPVWFELMDKPSFDRVFIKQVCFEWDHQDGAARIINFSVTDGANTYQLSLDTKSFTWKIAVSELVEHR